MYIKLESELPWIKSKKEIPIRYDSHYVIKGGMPESGKLAYHPSRSYYEDHQSEYLFEGPWTMYWVVPSVGV